MKKMTVRSTLIFEIDLEEHGLADHEEDVLQFMIEENSCPWTGIIGCILSGMIEKHEKNGTCWACALRWKNEIISGESNVFIPDFIDVNIWIRPIDSDTIVFNPYTWEKVRMNSCSLRFIKPI